MSEMRPQSMHGLFGWTEAPFSKSNRCVEEKCLTILTAACQVVPCTNSFRSKQHLQYHRIPRTEKLRKSYQVLLRNETLKLHLNQTRVCSEHFEGGQKLSRQHLPSLFPWTKRAEQKRQIIKHEHEPKRKKKKEESNLSVPAVLTEVRAKTF